MPPSGWQLPNPSRGDTAGEWGRTEKGVATAFVVAFSKRGEPAAKRNDICLPDKYQTIFNLFGTENDG